jgi:hypothetical protein
MATRDRRQPEPIEDKAIGPDEAKPATVDGVKVRLAHYWTGRDGTLYKPGDTATLPKTLARSLIGQGYARPVEG